MELQATTINTLDVYWQTFFACAVTSFDAPQTRVVSHAGVGAYHGVFLFRRAHTLIISVPPAFDAGQRAALATMTVADFDNRAALYDRIPARIERMVGPAFIGYADATTLQPYHSSAVRLLTERDAGAYTVLRDACPAIDWEHGGSAFGEQRLVGAFVDDQLAALAGCERWGTQIAHIAVVTHPAYRGRGYGKGVVSVLSETVLQDGLIPQYRTLRSNTASMSIVAELGFVAYADSMAVLLV